MRIVRAALILGLLAGGCVSVRGAGADSNSIPPRPEGAPYPNWEHMCVHPGIGGSSDLLNGAGEQGWELVAITGEGVFCFKRPVMPPGGVFPPPPGPPPPPRPPAAPGSGPPLGADPYAEHGPPPPPSPPGVTDPFAGGPPPPPSVRAEGGRDPFAASPEAPAAPAPPSRPDEANPFSQGP